jgi:hypothetical protein
MMSTEFSMMLEAFMELAKQQDQKLLDGAVMVFLPAGGHANDASIFAWVSEETEKEAPNVWHDVFVAMLFALLKSGVDPTALHELIEFAKVNVLDIVAKAVESPFEDGPAN